MSTWNAADEPTDPDPAPLVVDESWIDSEFKGGGDDWIVEHLPMVFVDAIAAVALLYIIARALGLL